jgi:3-oxoacyl-[acyl-carrier-protein] synthase-1
MKTTLAVTGIGMLSPVGLSGLIALHSIRSGVSRLTLQPFPDRVRQWIVGSSIPKWVPLVAQERLAALAFDAINAALERADAPLTDAEARGTTALILGCPETGRPGYQFPPTEKSRAADWTRQTVLETLAAVDVVAAGSCSAQLSLGRAADLLAKPSIRRCVVGAVDTQLQLRTIRWHEAHSRLKCSYITDGLIPAEAACFVVLESEPTARARGAKILARIASVNVAREAATILSDRPNTAAGLTKVVRATLAEGGVRPGDVGMVWSDLNGESYRAREWAFAEVRLGFTTSTELMHPADCHGDLGAATDAGLLGLAALSHATGWSDGKPLLVISGSEGGLRAASLLTASEGAGSLLQVSRRFPRAFTTTFRVPPPPVPPADFRRSEDPPRSSFEWQLYEGHRDALASLHYQRNALLQDDTIPWPRLREPEQRILNHLDAAVASGPTSMAVVAAGVRADEEGLAFAGSLLLGALPHRDNFALIEAACEQAAAPQLEGLAAGLTHAAPSEALHEFITHSIASTHPAVQAMAISVAAKRHINIGPLVGRLGEVADGGLAKAIADAAWRMRVEEVASILQRLLSHQRPDVRRSAAFALLRLVPARAAAFARSRLDLNAEFGGALAICIAVTGDISDAPLLLTLLERNPADLSAVAALGILGAPDSVPELITLLQSGTEDTKLAAASALELISGHRPRERVVRISEPDASAEESAAPETREVEQVVTSPEYWANWWHVQRSRLRTNLRWRRGSTFTLGSCIDELSDARSTLASRRRAYMELTTLAPVRIPFEPDWFVARQEEAIDSWRSWWESSRATR